MQIPKHYEERVSRLSEKIALLAGSTAIKKLDKVLPIGCKLY